MERNLSVELRPKTLDEFLGCENIIGPIKEGLKQGRIASTYIITGPPGTGKTSLARAIIQFVNGPLDYYDISEPDTSELGADNIRPLIDSARLSPQWGSYKGIIIDEAHKLVASTQDMLLKATEEPCPSTIWFICSSEPSKLKDALKRRGSYYIMEGLGVSDTLELVHRTLNYTGEDIKNKYSSKAIELTNELFNRDIKSPGLIIQAVERLITGISVSAAAQVTESTTVDTFAIARSISKGDWPSVQSVLQIAPRSSARDIRSAVAGYFRSILVGKAGSEGPALGSQRAELCVWAIQEMANLSNQNQFEDGLIMAATSASLYRICAGWSKHVKSKTG